MRLMCLDCQEVLESRHRHDFVRCSCGNAFVDGGGDYFRYGAKNEDRIQVVDGHIDTRNILNEYFRLPVFPED